MPLDLVILMLGTNDLKIEFNRNPRNIAEAAKGLITLIQGKTAKDGHDPARIVLVSPILVDDQAPSFAKFYVPDYYNHESAIKSQQLSNELTETAVETNCTFVDAAKVAHAGDDGLHFSQEAHASLADLLIQTVQTVFDDASQGKAL